MLIFPTNAVCNSFYRELSNPNFPNRYQDYLQRGGFHDSKKALELTGILRNGTVAKEFLEHPDLPSAPLRAFSYTMAGVSVQPLLIISSILVREIPHPTPVVRLSISRTLPATSRSLPTSARRVRRRAARGRTPSSSAPTVTSAPSLSGCRGWAVTTTSSAMATRSRIRSSSWTR